MCDYSLHAVASRPATIGDKLVTAEFANTYTRGFAAVGEPNVAVCLLPGTEVGFEKDAELGRLFGLIPRKIAGGKVARFRKASPSDPCVHHDALEFPSGRVVLLTNLRKGQNAAVLQLPVHESARARGEQQTLVAPPLDAVPV